VIRRAGRRRHVAATDRHADRLAGGVGSGSGIPGIPVRGGLLGWLLGSRAKPLSGIAEVDEGDLKAAVDWSNYLETPPPASGCDRGERLGICCSGGGIRAASFCLGGLEAVRAGGYFKDDAYLSAVSGGGYIAVAHAALLGLSREHTADGAAGKDRQSRSEAIKRSFRELPPWSLAAPETINLRNHTTYLAPNLAGRIWGVSVVVYGAVRHLLPFAALVVALGTLYGWVLISVADLVFSAGHTAKFRPHSSALTRDALFAAALPLALAALCIAARQAIEHVGSTHTRRGGGLFTTLLLTLATAGIVGVVAATVGLHWMRGDAGLATSLLVGAVTAGGTVVLCVTLLAIQKLAEHIDGLHGALEVWTVRLTTLAAIGGLLLCLVPLLFTQIVSDAHWLAGVLGGDVSLAVIAQQIVKYSTSAAASRWLRIATVVASYVAGPLVVLGSFLLVAYVAAERGIAWAGFGTPMWLILAAAFLLLTWLFDDEVTVPLHLLYRERLSTAFIRYRAVRGSRIATAEPDWTDPINLVGMDLRGMPKLVVCASVNVADDVVPPGRFAGPFTFEQHRSGGPLTGYVETSELQRAAGDGVLTLPGMMAIAGAAFSPLMGRTTRPGWRLLFALFDLRLGMWLPNPRWLPGVETARKHPMTPLSSGKVEQLATHHSRFDRAGAPPVFLRPGWSYALREALGLNSLRRPYVYVTDGGHWENLGLVELFRRGCTRIVCFDASEDHKLPLTALGQAIALARDELGVDVSIDTKDIWPGSAGDKTDGRLAKSMVAKGTFTYPDKRTGVLLFVKNHLPADAPRDVLSYAETNKAFPFDSTLDQFFDDQRFDAYRVLGEHGGQQAIELLDAVESKRRRFWQR
jgi:hypothetical protein